MDTDNKAFDHDKDVWDIAQDQSDRHLLSDALTKQDVDKIIGKGKWRGIRRRGPWQSGKVRGIDNARTSGHNFTAWLQDTIMTTQQEISLQILCWFFNGKPATARFAEKQHKWVGLSADDLADAYHGVPNLPHQLNLCIVAVRNPTNGFT